MTKFFEKRSKLLFLTVGIQIIYFIYLSTLYIFANSYEYKKISLQIIGNVEGPLDMYNTLTKPSYIIFIVALILNIVGLLKRKNGLVFVGVIANTISAIINPIYLFFSLPIVIINITGYAVQMKISSIKDYKQKVSIKTIEKMIMLLMLIAIFFVVILIAYKIDIFFVLRELLFDKILKL